ncbi:AAA family ATPase [Halobacillus litoralis]|uniref:AAA family ATPase n=1 Tax=Halobacillus litoralis TaxID=45668 RepID=UPI001CD31ED1|nr:AAA family ATPase [Halobacillus litoralis]MCA1023148.1 AAA family ATPase [Halobacillus litoralis]
MYPQAKTARPGTINIVLQDTSSRSVPESRTLTQERSPFRMIEDFFSSIVGLEALKRQMKEIYAQVVIAGKRADAGLKKNQQVLHMVFKGNPGTGKTTLARMVARLFHEAGVLEKGHFIEADRSDLVGEYIGHTAQKTKDLIHKALGGVLFIDEAYSLARGGEKDFGKEAIDTIVKCMEDHHDELVIILAGYPDEMEDFLTINPGLASRFPLKLTFKDYSWRELSAIAAGMLQDREYQLTPAAEVKLQEHLRSVCSRSLLNFSNARYVRNMIEEAVRRHAFRVMAEESPQKEVLMTLEAEDFSFPKDEERVH